MTISGAGTDNGGGAIYSFGDSLISNLTIAGNNTNAPGGALLNRGQARFKDTIVAGNLATPAGNCAGTGTFTSSGFNLESANSCGFNAPGDLVNPDPLLGPVQNNGGPTPTQALLGRQSSHRRRRLHRPRGPAIDDRSAWRGAAAARRRQVRHRSVRADARRRRRRLPRPAAVPGTRPPPAAPARASRASVNPQGQATTVFFQYGIDARYRPGGGTAVIYDQSTPPQTLPPDSTPHAVAAAVTGLVPNAVYHVAPGGDERHRHHVRTRPDVHHARRSGAAAGAGARPERERQAGQRPGVHPRRDEARAAHRSASRSRPERSSTLAPARSS